jgi:hypothetical protein
VELGLGLPGVKTALNAERGLALIGGIAGDETMDDADDD